MWDDYLIGKVTDMLGTGRITVSCSQEHLEDFPPDPETTVKALRADEQAELEFMAHTLARVAAIITQESSLEQESIGDIVCTIAEAKVARLYNVERE